MHGVSRGIVAVVCVNAGWNGCVLRTFTLQSTEKVQWMSAFWREAAMGGHVHSGMWRGVACIASAGMFHDACVCGELGERSEGLFNCSQ